MNTENLNINAEAGRPEEATDKNTKAKKIAGESAKYAAAAGVGVAGTMAANAFPSIPDGPDDHDVVTVVDAEGTPMAAQTVETPEEFDPNDIRLDEVEAATIPEVHVPQAERPETEDVAEVQEIQPVTEENDIAMINFDDIAATDEDMYTDGGLDQTDGIDEFGNPEDLAAADEPTDDIDILDDLLS